MMTYWCKWIGIFIVAFSPAIAAAEDFKLIANPSLGLSSVKLDELRSLYLRTANSVKGAARVEPVMQKASEVQKAFAKEALGMDLGSLWSYYRQLVFTGTGGTPKIVEGDDAVLEYVKKTKNAIGIVSKTTATNGVAVVNVMEN